MNMAKVAFGVKSEPTDEEIEAANALLLLWERATARNKQIHDHATRSAAHALFLRSHYNRQQTAFQRSMQDLAGYLSVFTPQPYMLASPVFSHYGTTINTRPHVGTVRMDPGPTSRDPPAPHVDKINLDSQGHGVGDNKRSSSEQILHSDLKTRRRRNSSQKSEPKRRRKNLTKEQVGVLEEAYSVSKYPQVEDRVRLQGPTKLSEARIQVWFQNRRAKERRQVESQHPGTQDACVTTSGIKDHSSNNSQESTGNEDTLANTALEKPVRNRDAELNTPVNNGTCVP